MKNFKKPKNNQKLLDIKISADRTFELMRPYMYILESDNGFEAKLLVTRTAMSVFLGTANTKDLALAIRQASSMVEIPIEALTAYAETVRLAATGLPFLAKGVR